jgi:hypothetical protein
VNGDLLMDRRTKGEHTLKDDQSKPTSPLQPSVEPRGGELDEDLSALSNATTKTGLMWVCPKWVLQHWVDKRRGQELSCISDLSILTKFYIAQIRRVLHTSTHFFLL